MFNICVVGMGYVGCANALLLSQNSRVVIVDISQDKVEDFNRKILPVHDSLGEEFLKNESLDIRASSNLGDSIKGADYVILALPTDYDEKSKTFITSALDEVAEFVLSENDNALVIIKSTIPIGYVENLREKMNTKRIVFSPEFLREGHALEDNLYPSRIIVGDDTEKAKRFSELLRQNSRDKKVKIHIMSPQAAECVKLFSNAYLAMRVAYFNELDSFCMLKDINVKEVVEGVSDDLRIGQYYNNPSFGYGGYCLPKDTKHLLENFLDIPQELISAIVNSNVTRKNLLAQEILRSNPSNVGIYRLAMKAGSDNYRDSAVLDIIDVLLDNKVNVFVYDPELKLQNLERVSLISDLEEFISKSDLILANRFEKNLSNCREKVFTRDIFGTDD